MNARDNELLTRTGAGTAMGELLRRYWMPILCSSELPEPDCTPVRVTILGEHLIAIRVTDGSISLFQEHCPHRRASLYFGRNEQQGIRCVYHGWKFDGTGQCVETPGELNANFKNKIKLTSYPCREQGGVIWTYMGPSDLQPALPQIEWSLVPESHRFISKRIQETNWFQALEGGWDYIHIGMLHRGAITLTTMTGTPDFAPAGPVVQEAVEMDYGLLFGRAQTHSDDRVYWMCSQLLMPSHKLLPHTEGSAYAAHVWVPIDDEHCMLWSIDYRTDAPLDAAEIGELERWFGIHAEVVPGTDRAVFNKTNDYGIDRVLQKSGESFTGIKGLGLQDAAIQESQGTIYDRTQEHLCSSDQHIIALRRYFLKLVHEMRAGTQPPGLDPASHSQRPQNAVSAKNVPFATVARHESVV